MAVFWKNGERFFEKSALKKQERLEKAKASISYK